ncbi:MAG: hypothetical protein ACLQU2_29555 [Candidatus Binataceae bacterium]
MTSEDASIDAVRKLLLSPNEQGNYQLLNTSASTDPATAKLFNNKVTRSRESFDSAGEDGTTGIHWPRSNSQSISLSAT